MGVTDRVQPGETVAITAGSRGVANIQAILQAAAAFFQRLGLQPFLFPAMGSHGGGTAEGQRGVLEGYGITESSCGCPIRATMETVEVFPTQHGFSVHLDRYAHEADHILVVNRIKPHTMFVGPIESGLSKMMLIGMGKHHGATLYHRAIQAYSFAELIEAAVPQMLERLPILGGLGIVENSFEETALIEGIPASNILQREPELMLKARDWMARLPFEEIDVLIVDEMGKNISGTGIDTNVVGRKFDDNKAIGDEKPDVRRIVVRSLTAPSHGNAAGIGVADFITRDLYDAIDFDATKINGVTAGHIGAVKIPPVYDCDRDAIDAALSCIGLREPGDARVVRVKNTLELVEIECSDAYYESAQKRSDLEVVGEPRALAFSKSGALDT